MNINERIVAIREEMKSKEIDAYIVPSSDPHNSEYVADLWKSREWVSGFTGSAGVVVITMDHAGLWTDSRYFLQAEDELSDSEFQLHKVINQFAPQHLTWLVDTLDSGANIGFDGYCVTHAMVGQIEKLSGQKKFNIKAEFDLFNSIWKERPSIPSNPIYEHDIKYAGKSCTDKIKEIREMMFEKGVQYHLITTLDDIAWIFNIRGNDVECNPVAVCSAIIGINGVRLYITEDKVPSELTQRLKEDQVEILDYDALEKDLNELDENKTMLVDPYNCNYNLFRAINAKKQKGKTISRRLKALKNSTEIEHFRKVMIKDGAALTKAFFWLENILQERTVSEFEFSEKLAECRATQEAYKGESFHAIIGYKGNGAVIHYRPMDGQSKSIANEGVLLCDSGGQYLDGTTDITRTICLSPPSEEVKENFTLVLKGMISLTQAKFPKGTTGNQLDILARQFLWAKGLNYLHGTGHGVGFFLNVHEAPQGFAPGTSGRGVTKHEPGMVSSNEPGYYKEGEYGIRIENLILTTEDKDGFLGHETLTLFPIESQMINESMLSSSEKEWLNAYHEEVYQKISPILEEKEKEWLKAKCVAI